MTETVAAVAVVVVVVVAVAVTASDEIIGRHIHLGVRTPQNFTGEVRVPLQLSTFPY